LNTGGPRIMYSVPNLKKTLKKRVFMRFLRDFTEYTIRGIPVNSIKIYLKTISLELNILSLKSFFRIKVEYSKKTELSQFKFKERYRFIPRMITEFKGCP
jgi:hypothetical protein